MARRGGGARRPAPKPGAPAAPKAAKPAAAAAPKKAGPTDPETGAATDKKAAQQLEKPNPRVMPAGYVLDGSVYTYSSGHPYYGYHRRKYWYRYNRSSLRLGGVIVLLIMIGAVVLLLK